MKALENEGVDILFGLPGGAILPVYDPLIDSSIRHVLVRHEQGAGHMAEGYAHATGRPAWPWSPRVRRPPHCHSAVRCLLDSIPMVVVPARFPMRPSAPTHSRSVTPPASHVGHKHNYLDRGGRHPQVIPRLSTSPPPVGPDPCWWTSPKTVDPNQSPFGHGVVHTRQPTLPWLPPQHRGRRRADPPGGQAHLRGRAPGALHPGAAS